MDYRLLGFFSGFPNCRFPHNVAKRLSEELIHRQSLVFVSAWPEDYARNDSDSAGMHGMFEEYNIPFGQYHVIDNRMEASKATQLIHEASCVFLMGGHPGLQLQSIRDKGLDSAICGATAAVLGVSAGAINMAKYSLDTKESLVPYNGLGLADITIKPHFNREDHKVLKDLLLVSEKLPIYATEDDSAVFVMGENALSIGKICRIHRGNISPVQEGTLLW